MQIKSDNFQIIYPEGFYKEANRTANILEFMYNYAGEDLERRPKKVSILLYNQSTLSNGFVVWAPKRAEWITTPPLETYAQDWLEQLALHEFRHVIQIDKLEQGFTKIMKFIFGEMIVGATAGYIPFWFLEGDATVSETAFSSTGRGRDPGFMVELRALEIENQNRYSYDQSYLGSYKHFIPDHYKYGYQMVSYGKLKYGSKLWNKTLNNVARRPFTFAPFYFGLRSGHADSKVKLYQDTFDSLKIQWQQGIKEEYTGDYSKYYTPDTKNYTNYLFPHKTEHGLFAVKSSIDDITRFVMIHDSVETLIHTPGRYLNTKPAVSDKYIVWEENVPDKRWQKRTYSVIKVFDLEKKKERTLTKKSRFFYPAISPDNKRIACIEIDELNQFSIIVLAMETGDILEKLVLENGENVQGITWMGQEKLVYIAMDRNGKYLKEIDLMSGTIKVFYNSGNINIMNPVQANDWILFTRDTEIARNIYAYSLKEGSVFRITDVKYAAGYPSFDQYSGAIVFSDYSISGYRPVGLNFKNSEKMLLDSLETYKFPWAESLSKIAGVNLQRSNYEKVNFDSLRYRRILHAINIHSWAPFYFDTEDFTSYNPRLYPGITILSQNKLSTVTSSLSYYYTEGIHHVKPRLIFEGLYPVFEIGALITSNPAAINTGTNIPGPKEVKNFYELNIRSYIPLNFTRNKYTRYFQPTFEYTHWNGYYFGDSTYHLGFDYLEFSLYGSHLLKKSPRDLYPKFGQTLYLKVNKSLKDPAAFSSKNLAILNLYFPGFIPHHSTRFYLAHEKNENKNFILRPQASLPRGYLSDTLKYADIISGKIEYTFPLCYPDFNIGPLIYFKRFHASIFADVASTKYIPREQDENLETQLLFSVGATFAGEINLLRFFMPFTPKITFSYLPDQSAYDVTFNISINSTIF
jgi:hypothetical protein